MHVIDIPQTQPCIKEHRQEASGWTQSIITVLRRLLKVDHVTGTRTAWEFQAHDV